MLERATATTTRRRGLPVMLVVALATLFCGQGFAAETASEQAQLAMLQRQLDALERLAQEAAKLQSDGATRYHFDYSRLYADIERVRAGIRDYLTPQRAQPRDGDALLGRYRSEQSTAKGMNP